MECFASGIESMQPMSEYPAPFPLESGLKCYVW